MSKKQAGKIVIHSTESGKLYIKEDEFFANQHVKEILVKLLNSSLYKKIKESETSRVGV